MLGRQNTPTGHRARRWLTRRSRRCSSRRTSQAIHPRTPACRARSVWFWEASSRATRRISPLWGGKTSDVLRRLVRRRGVVRSTPDAIGHCLWLDAPSPEGSAIRASDAAWPRVQVRAEVHPDPRQIPTTAAAFCSDRAKSAPDGARAGQRTTRRTGMRPVGRARDTASDRVPQGLYYQFVLTGKSQTCPTGHKHVQSRASPD